MGKLRTFYARLSALITTLPKRLIDASRSSVGSLSVWLKALSVKGRYLLALALTAVIVTTSWAVATAPERNYLNDLRSGKLISEFSNETVAVLQGRAYCAELETGKDPVGFKRQKIAVKHFCSAFLAGYEVIPTPEEQQSRLLKELRAAGFGGRFASDAQAVTQAKAVCSKLSEGGKPQGIEADFIAVKIYCSDFVPGFRVLEEINVKATFQLVGSRYGWFPSIGGSSTNCYGRGGFSDISSSSGFTVTNSAGEVLAEGEIGKGKGGGDICKFTFEFVVLEGESKYFIEVGKRGKVKFSEAQLKIPGRVHLYL